MKDFFARQEEARHQSGRLLILFALAVAGVAVAVYLVATLAFIWFSHNSEMPLTLWQPRLFLWTSGGTLLAIAVGSLWKMSELRSGGTTVAMILGARPVPLGSKNQQEQRLRNVVEEMAIASGVPVPDLYLMENERGINGFAAGHDVDDAVICVTRGALELLDRDELQGVVAHEFSHILNGDMRLNLSLLGWLNGILVVSQLGEGMLRGMSRARGRSAGAAMLLGAALYAVGYVGYFFGSLIKSAVSRQREYLGDASAVQFTRNPEGLAGALKKIGGLGAGSRLDHPRASEVSHMFFSNGLEEAWLSALDTHPPLEERIRLLDPRFDGTYPKVTPLPTPPPAEIYIKPQPAKATAQPAPALTGAAVAAMLEQVGEPMQEHLNRARRLIAEIPATVAAAIREPLGACAVVCGLLLDRDPAVRARQEELLEASEPALLLDEIRRLVPAIGELSQQVRLPLLDLSLPALRALSREQFLRLQETVGRLTNADSRVNVFEFALRYLLIRHLAPRFTPSPPRQPQIYGIRGVQKECSLMLTALARVGQSTEAEAQAAFARGIRVLQEPKTEFPFLPAPDCAVPAMEEALYVLDTASPLIKRKLLAACLECLVHDNAIKVAEVELFRAIADAIGCPVPPWLENSSQKSTIPHQI